MWNNNAKTSTPRSIVASTTSSAANSQPNGHLQQQAGLEVAGDSMRKKLFDEDTFHMESIVNLEKECQQTLGKILLDPLSPNAVAAEQQMWSCFIKQYKMHLNSFMVNYLLGFYETLTQTIFFSTPRKDNFLKFNRSSFEVSQTNQELLYHINIRIGDLYRYVDSRANAKNYYQQALQIDPRRGTAYNQLALCTPLTKPYKLLYFSALASKSAIDPIKSATANFKKALSRLDSPLFDQFRAEIGLERNEAAIEAAEPETGADWFYLSVISIHLNNFNYTLVALLDWILQLTANQSNGIDLDYSLMALDVALDWIMKNRDNVLKKESLEQTLRLIGNQFKTTLNLEDTETNNKLVLTQMIALKHNFILKDFTPLKDLYETMCFCAEMQRYVVKRDRKILTTRLIHKLRSF